MRNRGNGKGGGIAACGLVPEEMGVSRKVLEDDYILQVALMDASARGDVEQAFIDPWFDIDQGGLIPTVDDYRAVPLLEVRPPDVARYFVRVKPAVLARFADEKGLAGAGLSERDIEDEFVYQNSIRLNNQFYASLGDKRAFVMSHARNQLIVKIVGFAEASVQYYRMEDTRAHVWIAQVGGELAHGGVRARCGRRDCGWLPRRRLPLSRGQPSRPPPGRTRAAVACRDRPGAGTVGDVQPVFRRGAALCGDCDHDDGASRALRPQPVAA
jgi:hypothetical protein